MNLIGKLEYKIVQLLCKILDFKLEIKEKDNIIEMNFNVNNSKGKKNVMNILKQVKNKINVNIKEE